LRKRVYRCVAGAKILLFVFIASVFTENFNIFFCFCKCLKLCDKL